MARVFDLAVAADDICKNLARSFQSANVNFLIGSGASFPAISSAGNVEKEIAKLFDAGDDDAAYEKLYAFLTTIQTPTNKLIAGVVDANNEKTVANYTDFLGTIESILGEQRTSLLPKQATIFTTNYDLFIEQASVPYSAMRLNDGFVRIPSLTDCSKYSSRTFFTMTSSAANLYNYKVDITCINLMKLHGSLSWKKESEHILFSILNHAPLPATRTAAQTRTFVDQYAVVLPETRKFHTTLMDDPYYELLRIYANEMDREGTLLIAFGFSFGDKHILEITKRGLKNPTLKLVIFAFEDSDKDSFQKIFEDYNNVDIIAPGTLIRIDFATFNETLRKVLPAFYGQKK
jgi:hypothetical protein